jgi:hypothetical protein
VNVARGYRRLAIAIVGSWATVWAVIGGFAAYQQYIWSNMFIEASRANRTAELVLASQQAQENGELVSLALMWGMLAVPLALIFMIGWWVYRGFVSRNG